MRVLLDSHTLVEWIEGGRRLSSRARRTIANPRTECAISLASCCEVAIEEELAVVSRDAVFADYGVRRIW